MQNQTETCQSVKKKKVLLVQNSAVTTVPGHQSDLSCTWEKRYNTAGPGSSGQVSAVSLYLRVVCDSGELECRKDRWFERGVGKTTKQHTFDLMIFFSSQSLLRFQRFPVVT